MNAVLADDVAHVAAGAYLETHVTNPLLRPETIRADGSAVNHDPENLVRTQDLEPWFEEDSNLYLFTRDSFAATGARIGRKFLLFETPRLESVDIDDRSDWDLALAAARPGPKRVGRRLNARVSRPPADSSLGFRPVFTYHRRTDAQKAHFPCPLP